MVRYEDSPYNDLDMANNYEINHSEDFSFNLKEGNCSVTHWLVFIFKMSNLIPLNKVINDSLCSFKV